MNRRPRWPHLVLIPAIIVCWAPLYFTMVIASRDAASAATVPPPVLPGDDLLANLARVLDAVPIAGAIRNSVIVASIVAVGQAFLCALAGFAFAKLRFRGRDALFVLVLVALALPTQLSVIPRYMMIGALGWLDALHALIVPGLVSAFGVFWMRQHFTVALPDEVLHAAAIDGCGPWRAFWSVGFPLARSGAAVLGAITFVATWSDLLWPLLVTRAPGVQTVQVALAGLRSAFWVDHSLVFAGALLATAPMMILLFVAFSVLRTGAWRARRPRDPAARRR